MRAPDEVGAYVQPCPLDMDVEHSSTAPGAKDPIVVRRRISVLDWQLRFAVTRKAPHRVDEGRMLLCVPLETQADRVRSRHL